MILLNYGVFIYNKETILPKKCLLGRCRRILRINHEKSKKARIHADLKVWKICRLK